MGRAKLTLKCIENDKNRKLTFTRRWNGLKKKMNNFSSKCNNDFEACLIVYDDNDNGQPMIWPEDSTKVRSIIEKYELQKKENAVSNFHLKDFFKFRNNMTKVEISKVKKDILKIKYPTWDPSFTRLGVEQVGSFVAMLNAKIEECNHRIMMKNKNQVEANSNFMQNMSQLEGAASSPTQLNFVQNISNGQHIPTSMRPVDHSDGVVDFANQFEVTLGSTNHEHVDGAIQHGKFEDCANQIGMIEDTENQLGEAVNKVGHPDEFGDWANQLDNLTWTSQPRNHENWAKQLGSSMDWASQLQEFENWASKLGEPDNYWNSQHDLSAWASQPGYPKVEVGNHVNSNKFFRH